MLMMEGKVGFSVKKCNDTWSEKECGEERGEEEV